MSPDEQTRRLEARVDDGRKIWKLSPMDIKSYTRWDDYTKARDDMFAATDTAWAPWYVARSDDKRRARLNIISHLLSRIPVQVAAAREGEAAEAQDTEGAPGLAFGQGHRREVLTLAGGAPARRADAFAPKRCRYQREKALGAENPSSDEISVRARRGSFT